MNNIVRYHHEDNEGRGGQCAALIVKRGSKYLHIIRMDEALRIRKVPISEERFMRPMLYHDKAYPIGRAVKHISAMAKGQGAPKGVMMALAA